MLTYPARSKAIDTFADLLELPWEATIGIYRWSSMNEILRESSDTTLQECFITKLITLFSSSILKIWRKISLPL